MAESYVADSTVLIDFLRGVEHAEEFLSPLLERRTVVLHPIVHAEVLSGARDRRHLVMLDAALGGMRSCGFKGSDISAAMELVREHTLTHGVGWPDCLIAATCIRLGMPLITLNDRHFKRIRRLSVVRPY